jgi:hypothetical protein
LFRYIVSLFHDFFFLRHPSDRLFFVSYWQQKVGEMKKKNFLHKIRSNAERGRFFAKPAGRRIFRFTSPGYLCQSKEKTAGQDASNNEEWEKGNDIENRKTATAVELKIGRTGREYFPSLRFKIYCLPLCESYLK